MLAAKRRDEQQDAPGGQARSLHLAHTGTPPASGLWGHVLQEHETRISLELRIRPESQVIDRKDHHTIR